MSELIGDSYGFCFLVLFLFATFFARLRSDILILRLLLDFMLLSLFYRLGFLLYSAVVCFWLLFIFFWLRVPPFAGLLRLRLRAFRYLDIDVGCLSVTSGVLNGRTAAKIGSTEYAVGLDILLRIFYNAVCAPLAHQMIVPPPTTVSPSYITAA